ncbi:L-ascorbate metabolism protein UlaG (beta-lactamase superfamily) [Sphingobacterium paludis]|uniref:L-ascorbate metabolism protein UlaG (Beta-lactamase superfamily) n=2 Tax=Sphingobacterium paludis TaxID=1476465 RepID=A0A4R7CV01_9SPHI|nr:L-ascorbate metabolism protein UlaG (beta-lactamase superfamily) [Sphingobacterium paludis]
MFGQFPDQKRKAYFKTLKNYKDGQFQNQIPTPALLEGESMGKLLLEFFGKHLDTTPRSPLPHVKTDLFRLPRDKDTLVWFGHSSYFMQLSGKTFLVDPVFSGNASPVFGSVKAFAGADEFKAGDMPEIDVLLISHDHWDHLDYGTIRLLKEKVKLVVCGLGVAQHFIYWGWPAEKIVEKNWYEEVDVAPGINITLTPARHFSGRFLTRNISLWTSFVLQTPDKKLFLGGDSGYGPHFKAIGEKFGPFDLAILECGQYNERWPYIHSLPPEIIQEVKDLDAKTFMPVHHSKFKLAQHPWYEPLEQVSTLAEAESIAIATPKIGEQVDLSDIKTQWDKWWTPH